MALLDHVTDPITDLTNPHRCRPAPESSAIIGDVTASQLPFVPGIEPWTDLTIPPRPPWTFRREENTDASMNEKGLV